MTYKMRNSSKRILYRLHKGKVMELAEIAEDKGSKGRGRNGRLADFKVLQRLIKKGLVERSVPSERYILTLEGRKIAEKIAREVEEIKSW